MGKPDSPVSSVDEIIEQKKQELADWLEYRRLAAKLGQLPNQAPLPIPAALTHDNPSSTEFDGTIRGLLRCYRTDKRSPIHQLKFAVRKHYGSHLNRLDHDIGQELVAELDEAKIEHLYKTNWSANGNKLAMGHAMVGKLRMLSTFGSTVLKDDGCTHLAGVLAHFSTKTNEARTERLTSEHVNAIRKRAREIGRASIALAQAFQFEVRELRQLDLIGEWVPLNESGTSEVLREKRNQKQKWLRGLRWTDIDEHLILRKTVKKSRKAQPQEVEIDLTQCPMVLEELFVARGLKIDRSSLPTSALPVIVSETTELPYAHDDFRRKWRAIADESGVPSSVRNADSIRADKQGSQRTKATFPWQET